MTEDLTPERARRTWIALLAVAAAVAVVAALVAVLGPADADDRGRAAAGSTSTPASPSSTPAAPAAPATPAASAASAAQGTPTQTPQVVSPAPAVTGQVEGAPPSLEAVGLEDAVDAGQGFVAELSSISAIQASATGPGNIAGPALAVTVRITNGTGMSVRLADVEVALTYTAEEVAASPVDDDTASPLQGSLASGGSAEGTYVFSVPADQRQVVTVTVGLVAGAPLLVFSGAVA
ncbi:hypothetical protein QOZ88_21790 [Blastococcus sp. BMG 814]|uniref:DUF4352 domain-containing protein n=1 Tax=Blastococcus carthaginiensis TaxID=3050034 RepID=A0ABT9IJG8_9ACTN|nr:hypothetical protein [Blastococcus carthaginiensis]MDP5185274.1 hypothetical protein [Blastococcus carthaginiensis]